MNTNINKEIERLKEIIAKAPKGTITYKTINGKKQPYLQWTENGKSKSKFIKKAERETIIALVEERDRAIKRLAELSVELPKNTDIAIVEKIDFLTNVRTGKALLEFIDSVKEWKTRECFDSLTKYIAKGQSGRVCLLYGLRRTGKTTMLFQCIASLKTELNKVAYIKIKTSDTMAMLNKDMNTLFEKGFKYIFIDEVTLMADFISQAALLSDVFSNMGMKIFLSGTDSLGFWITLSEELYDRAYTIHTTFIPYREYSRLLDIHDIDEYIRYGGTLRMGDNNFDDEDALAVDATFRDDETTRKYIDTAICKNIQHSLACYDDGSHFMALKDLYKAGELTGAINRVIERANHEFILDVLTETFKSHDLGSAQQLLRKQNNQSLEDVNVEEVTKKLMSILEIRNKEELTVHLEEKHIEQIKLYLAALGLIEKCEVRYEIGGSSDYYVFTQPGMRYCQALALIHAVMKDDEFLKYSLTERNAAVQKISDDVCGRMLEDIVLLETKKSLNSNRYNVFKFVFAVGEYDMVVVDNEKLSCSIYEVKHSKAATPEQTRHLTNEDKQKTVEFRFGKIVKKCVLYKGKTFSSVDGVEYKNVEEYLSELA